MLSALLSISFSSSKQSAGRLEAPGQISLCFTTSFTTGSAGGRRGARASRRAAVCCLPGHSHPGATTCPPGPTSICPPQHTSTRWWFKKPRYPQGDRAVVQQDLPAAARWWGRVRSSPGGLKFGLNPGCNLLRAVCTLPAMSNSPAVLSAWEGSRQGQPMEENHTHPSRSHVPCSLETDPTRAKPA